MLKKASRATIQEKGNSNITGVCVIDMQYQMWQEGVGVSLSAAVYLLLYQVFGLDNYLFEE
jgi:hypothetical protein